MIGISSTDRCRAGGLCARTRPGRLPRWFRNAVLLLALLPVLAPRTADARSPICGPETHLTLMGADLRRGRILLSPVDSGEGDRPWIDLDLRSETALAVRVPDRASLPRGGSVASGFVVAARSCGASCLQLVRWRDGSWRGLGDPLAVDATGSLVETTYDGAGIPWLMLREQGSSPGTSEVTAYRIEGRRWKLQGQGEARITGSPFASPWPGPSRAVVAGDLRFAIGREPVRWLRPLPPGTRAGESQVFVLPDDRPLLLTGSGDLYLGREAESGWLPVRWRPWEGTASPGSGRLRVEILPASGRGEERATVWVDDRDPDDGRVHLVVWSSRRGWKPLLELPDGIRTTGGRELPYRQILRLDDGRWILVVGCVGVSGGGSGLAYLVFDGDSLDEPRVIPITGR